MGGFLDLGGGGRGPFEHKCCCYFIIFDSREEWRGGERREKGVFWDGRWVLYYCVFGYCFIVITMGERLTSLS